MSRLDGYIYATLMPDPVIEFSSRYTTENMAVLSLGEAGVAHIHALRRGAQGKDSWGDYDISWKGYDIP
jgi:hypothetical protein